MKRRLATVLATLAGLSAAVILVYQLPVLIQNQAPPSSLPKVEEPALFAETAVAAADADGLLEDELVIGLVIDGEPRAYPAGTLQGTELLHDQCGATPVLVTW